jgi:hypothetical protein
MPSFVELIESTWSNQSILLMFLKGFCKIEVLRKVLKCWTKYLSSLKYDIADINNLISLLNTVENGRTKTNREKSLLSH